MSQIFQNLFKISFSFFFFFSQDGYGYNTEQSMLVESRIPNLCEQLQWDILRIHVDLQVPLELFSIPAICCISLMSW